LQLAPLTCDDAHLLSLRFKPQVQTWYDAFFYYYNISHEMCYQCIRAVAD